LAPATLVCVCRTLANLSTTYDFHLARIVDCAVLAVTARVFNVFAAQAATTTKPSRVAIVAGATTA
jgi:hypothetical protein